MDHSHASEHYVVEQYLLDELSPELRDEFEEHFFECQTCAAELRATDAYLRTARVELAKGELSTRVQAPAVLPFRTPLRKFMDWRYVATLSALAASLLVMVYQNLVTLPQLHSEAARLDRPEVLPSISLVGGTSRGGDLPSVPRNGAQSILLRVDIPIEERFTSYICSLYTPAHELISTVELSPEQASNTVSIRVPLRSNVSGTYSMEVRGHGIKDNKSLPSDTELTIYHFNLDSGSKDEAR